MKQEDAKKQIIDLWSKSKKDKPGLNVLHFYLRLEKEHPELLKFQCNEDKYQRIKGWLRPHADKVDN